MTTSAPPRPPRSCIDILASPAPLRRRDQWAAFRYGFRDGSWTKIPKQPNGKNARSNDPKTWSPFKVAWAAFEADPTLDGIGYFFSEDDPYCFVDIDKVKSSPERLAWALGIVERFGTYAEWSVSDNGLHLIGEGRMPDADGTPQKGRNDQKKGLEAYSRRRFATFTGKVVEDATTALAECQAALDWLLANEFKPKDPGKPAVRIDRPAGLIASTDRIERIKEKMFSGPRGAQLRRLYDGDAGDYRKPDGSPDWSGADGSLCSGAWYYADGDLATTEAIWLMSGLAAARPNAEKLNRADYRQSTLQLVSGGKTFRDTHGYSAWEDPPRIQFTPTPAKPQPVGNDGATVCPSDEPATLEDALVLIAQLREENTELRQTVRDLDVWVDRTAGFVEDLQACNATLSRKLTAAEQQIERLNREKHATWRIRRSKLKSSQADSFFGIVNLASNRADYFDTDTPIITSEQLAKEFGVCEQTARTNAEAVCNLPGSPIKRVTDYRTDGKRGKLTTYELAVRDPVELLERMAVVAEALDKPKPNRSEPPRCKKHPKAGTVTYQQTCCKECGQVLASDFPQDHPLYVKVSSIEHTPDGVDAPVLSDTKVSRIAESGVPAIDELAERRARAAQQVPLGREVDRWKRPPKRSEQRWPDRCEVHQRQLTYDEFEDGGCSWCATAAAVADAALPLMAGGEE